MRIRMIYILLFFSIFTSCFDEKYDFESYYLISKIYSADKKRISTYRYNEKNQLIKREYLSMAPYNSSYIYDTYLYYPDGLLKRIITTDEIYEETYIDDYFYDNGTVVKLNNIIFIYNRNGEISHYFEDKELRSKFEYLNKNVVKETYYYVDDWSGKHLSRTIEYKYDHKKRPSDGLNYIPRRHPLPLIEQNEIFVPSLSKNNFIRSNIHPVSYLYKYDQNDLPVEIKAIYQQFINFTPYKSDTTTYIIEYQKRQ
jgi:hypothetical protein